MRRIIVRWYANNCGFAPRGGSREFLARMSHRARLRRASLYGFQIH